MEVLNYKSHNANEIAANILNSNDAFRRPERKRMNRVERIKDTVERWYALHPDTYRDPHQRGIMKHLYTALAYMGDGEACSSMEMLALTSRNPLSSKISIFPRTAFSSRPFCPQSLLTRRLLKRSFPFFIKKAYC